MKGTAEKEYEGDRTSADYADAQAGLLRTDVGVFLEWPSQNETSEVPKL